MNNAIIDASTFQRINARVNGVGEKATKARNRAMVTLMRRLKPEAARQVASIQLNVPASKISPSILTRLGNVDGDDYVAVTASKKRLPLSAFKPSVLKGRGATVTTWKDAAPVVLPHAFKRGKEVWQRVPYKGQKGQTATPLGLVQRLPIVMRKGPSLKRALQKVGPSQNDHGREEVVANIMHFGQTILSAEIRRQLALK